MKKHLDLIFVSIVSIVLTASYFNSRSVPVIIDGGIECDGYGCSTESITNMYAGYIEQWKKQISDSFDEAEIKVFNKTPTPDIVGPNEDADKCVCKGTGVITHGDGHKTPCPYHGSQEKMENMIFKQLPILEE